MNLIKSLRGGSGGGSSGSGSGSGEATPAAASNAAVGGGVRNPKVKKPGQKRSLTSRLRLKFGGSTQSLAAAAPARPSQDQSGIEGRQLAFSPEDDDLYSQRGKSSTFLQVQI